MQTCSDPSQERNYKYHFDGKDDVITLKLYSDMNEYASCVGKSIPGSYSSQSKILGSEIRNVSLSERDTTLMKLNNSYQELYLSELFSQIRTKATIPDDQARIAMSLVQNIPYDYSLAAERNSGKASDDRLPYEVLFENKGVCSEKSKLLAFLLKELGYGVALLEYEKDNHTAVGIKVPNSYAYRAGYAYIETTNPFMVCYIPSNITSEPEIIKISDGRMFEDINEDYKDAFILKNLEIQKQITTAQYDTLKNLKDKYGLNITLPSKPIISIPAFTSLTIGSPYSTSCGLCPVGYQCINGQCAIQRAGPVILPTIQSVKAIQTPISANALNISGTPVKAVFTPVVARIKECRVGTDCSPNFHCCTDGLCRCPDGSIYVEYVH